MNLATDNLQAIDEATRNRWVTAARVDGVEDNYAGKRAHPRTSWKSAVRVEALGRGAAPRPVYGYTRDISAGGVGLKCHERIKPCTKVQITLEDTGECLCGVVRHCSEGVGSFLIGVEFEFRYPEPTRMLKSA